MDLLLLQKHRSTNILEQEGDKKQNVFLFFLMVKKEIETLKAKVQHVSPKLPKYEESLHLQIRSSFLEVLCCVPPITWQELVLCFRLKMNFLQFFVRPSL